MKDLLCIWVVMTWACFGCTALAQRDDNKKPTQAAQSSIETQVVAVTKHLIPIAGKNAPKTQMLAGDRFALWGDLFGTEQVWAVAETTNSDFGIAYLEWKADRWHFREVWHATTDWIAQGSKPEDRGYYNVSPPHVPFTLKDLSGDAVPELLIYFNNDGHKDGYLIVKLAQDRKALKIAAVSEDGEPELAGGHFLTFDTSGRKSWWNQKLYHRWENDRAIHVATWTAGSVEETDQGPTAFTIETTKASSLGQHTSIIPKEEEKDQNGVFYVGPGETWKVMRDHKPFAEVTFHWKEGEPADPDAEYSASELFMFEKLTGLPAKAYGKEVNGMKIETAKARYPRFHTEVRGTKEGVRLFSKTK